MSRSKLAMINNNMQTKKPTLVKKRSVTVIALLTSKLFSFTLKTECISEWRLISHHQEKKIAQLTLFQ